MNKVRSSTGLRANTPKYAAMACSTWASQSLCGSMAARSTAIALPLAASYSAVRHSALSAKFS